MLRGITLWDVKSGETVVALNRPSATVWSLAFNPDGKTFLRGTAVVAPD
jgi:WD40 repeat protein